MIEAFRRDGFVVVPQFLDPSEVLRIRSACLAGPRGVAVGGGRVVSDLRVALPEVASLIFDPRTIAVARELIGARVLHLNHSALHVGPVNRGWHKDAIDYLEGRRDGPDWSDDYRLVHFAWYLQDHAAHGGGISFRAGSQRVRNHHEGEVVTPPIRSGDLVAFDLRTTHFGNTIQLRNGRPLFFDGVWRSRLAPWALSSAAVSALPVLFRPDHGASRLVLFGMYGADDAHTARFFRWLGTQPDLTHVRRYQGPAVVA